MTAIELLNSLKRFNASAEAFAAGVRIKIDDLAETQFGGRRMPIVESDQSLRLKDLLAAASIYDRDVLSSAPANRSWQCEIIRGWPAWLWRNAVNLVAVAAVDLNEIVRRAGDEARARLDWPPLTADALDQALGDLKAAPDRTFVAVSSASGFGQDAVELATRRAAQLEQAGGGLVLVRPRNDGGWVLRPFGTVRRLPAPEEPASVIISQAWHFIFDPETVDDKIRRIRAAMAAGQIDLTDRGLNARELAESLELPRSLVDQVFMAETYRRSDLRLRRFDDDLVLLGTIDFGADKAEANMTMFQKLRELLGLAGQEKRKIELLGDKRALLNARRDRLYRELDELGEREQTLLQRGISTDSTVMQRRVASELCQVRRRIEQGNTLVGLVNRQVDALTTHIHHLSLLAQGSEVELPSIEEMTRDAVRAEELIERIRADADVVESLNEVTSTSLDSVSEESVMAEFAAARQARLESQKPERQAQADRPAADRAPDRQPDRPHRDQPMKE